MGKQYAVIDAQGKEPLDGGYELRLTGWTEERYWRNAPSDRFWEFVDGEVVVASPVDIRHQRMVKFLTFLAGAVSEAQGTGEVLNGPAALRLRVDLAREPDIFVLPPEEAARARGSRIEACPCFILEVTDSDSERRDLVDKPLEYVARGVPDYWSVHLRKRRVTVFRGRKGLSSPTVVRSGRLDSTGLPGFWIDVSWLWQDPLPKTLACVKQILGVTSL